MSEGLPRAGRSRSGVQVFRKGEASLVPLWRQVYAQLRASIDSGALPVGSRIPSSRTLARELKVARNTVDGALLRLAREGLIERRVGSGTRVAEPRAPALESAHAPRDGVLD